MLHLASNDQFNSRRGRQQVVRAAPARPRRKVDTRGRRPVAARLALEPVAIGRPAVKQVEQKLARRHRRVHGNLLAAGNDEVGAVAIGVERLGGVPEHGADLADRHIAVGHQLAAAQKPAKRLSTLREVKHGQLAIKVNVIAVAHCARAFALDAGPENSAPRQRWSHTKKTDVDQRALFLLRAGGARAAEEEEGGNHSLATRNQGTCMAQGTEAPGNGNSNWTCRPEEK